MCLSRSAIRSRVSRGTSGERGLENAAAMGGVDLLITDVVMEPMDGFTLREEMRQRYPAARTILISGYDLSTTKDIAELWLALQARALIGLTDTAPHHRSGT